MSELITVQIVCRKDQEQLLKYLAERMNVSVSAIGRWALDDARAFLLARASLEETDLPQELRRA